MQFPVLPYLLYLNYAKANLLFLWNEVPLLRTIIYNVPFNLQCSIYDRKHVIRVLSYKLALPFILFLWLFIYLIPCWHDSNHWKLINFHLCDTHSCKETDLWRAHMGSFGQNALPSFNVMADGSESQSRTISIIAKTNIFSIQRETLVSDRGHNQGRKELKNESGTQ